jgi:biopolymer transport protein ExbD
MSSKNNLLFQILNIFLSVTLALLAFNLFAPILNEKTKTYIKYNIPSDDGEYPFNGHKIVDKLKSQFSIKTFSFTGNDKKDNMILAQFAKALAEESKKRYSFTIHRIYLPKNVTYGRFVELLNLMKKAGYNKYVEWENYFYVATNNAKVEN